MTPRISFPSSNLQSNCHGSVAVSLLLRHGKETIQNSAPRPNLFFQSEYDFDLYFFVQTKFYHLAAPTRAAEEAKRERQGAAKKSRMGNKATSHHQEHAIAERKRRERLSERFIALSAIIPGLKKMDKASVLGDAIKYLKQLQERIKALEDQVARRRVESAVFLNKPDRSSFCDEEDVVAGQSDEPLPEIEARVCQKTILIKIHCENRKGILVKLVSEIETLDLSVSNISAMPFAAASLDITVITQIEDEFSMTAKGLVKKLSSAFRQFMF